MVKPLLLIAWPVETQTLCSHLRPSLQVRAHGTGGNLGLPLPCARGKHMNSVTKAVSLLHLINTKFTSKRERKKIIRNLLSRGGEECKQCDSQPKAQEIISNVNKQVSGAEVHSQSDFIKLSPHSSLLPCSAASLRSHVSLFCAHRFP